MATQTPPFDVDCIVIGGGPAGLTAAIYLARFHLSVRVFDAGQSRASWIPRTHNHAGYPDGISGDDLLARMREQAERYGATIVPRRVGRLHRADDGFEIEAGEGIVRARAVLLATGVRNRWPSIDETLHAEALRDGYLRYCPVCDGYEVTDQPIAVIGTGERGVAEACFLRSYTREVTLVAPDGAHALSDREHARVADYGIALIDGPSHIVGIADGRILIETPRATSGFASIYPALGSDANNDLARSIRADTTEAGCVIVDARQRTSVPGLYAAGDLVVGLDQISHAMGEGAVAATTMRNDISEATPLLR